MSSRCVHTSCKHETRTHTVFHFYASRLLERPLQSTRIFNDALRMFPISYRVTVMQNYRASNHCCRLVSLSRQWQTLWHGCNQRGHHAVHVVKPNWANRKENYLLRFSHLQVITNSQKTSVCHPFQISSTTLSRWVSIFYRMCTKLELRKSSHISG